MRNEPSNFQRVRSGDLLVDLQDDAYKAQLAQATAAIENNQRQLELQDSRIQKALAGIDLAKAQIASACQYFCATDQTVIIVTTIG